MFLKCLKEVTLVRTASSGTIRELLILLEPAAGVEPANLLITNRVNAERASKFNSTGCSHGGFAGVFDDSIRRYIAFSGVYLNSRHNYVTSKVSLHCAGIPNRSYYA